MDIRAFFGIPGATLLACILLASPRMPRRRPTIELAQFYTRVGLTSHPMGRTQTFETRAAANTGARVRRELPTTPTRSANGS